MYEYHHFPSMSYYLGFRETKAKKSGNEKSAIKWRGVMHSYDEWDIPFKWQKGVGMGDWERKYFFVCEERERESVFVRVCLRMTSDKCDRNEMVNVLILV